MPGIDRQRIVGKDENELDELMCGICQDIFDEPVVTQCCRQTYCKSCINQWLANNNTCPIDRKMLSINMLVQPPRLVLDIFNKLMIKCENFENGCDAIIQIDRMKDHMKLCNMCREYEKIIKLKVKEIEILMAKLKSKDSEPRQMHQVHISNGFPSTAISRANDQTQFVWRTIRNKRDVILNEVVHGTYSVPYRKLDPTRNDLKFFIGRLYFSDNFQILAEVVKNKTLGTICFNFWQNNQGHTVCVFDFDFELTIENKTNKVDRFEILINPNSIRYKWVVSPSGIPPPGAFVCCEELGELFYCGRVVFESKLRLAKIKNGVAYFGDRFFATTKTFNLQDVY